MDIPLSTPEVQSFTDVPPSYFAYAYIESGYAAGVLGGYSATQCASVGAIYPCYMPNRRINRAEIARLVVNAAGYEPITPNTPTFEDVPPSYFAYAAIETAYARGMVHGVDSTHYRPNQSVRRDEMCQIIYSAINSR